MLDAGTSSFEEPVPPPSDRVEPNVQVSGGRADSNPDPDPKSNALGRVVAALLEVKTLNVHSDRIFFPCFRIRGYK